MNTIKQKLIDLFGLDKMVPKKATEMLERLSRLVFQEVLVRALPLLKKEDLSEYERIVYAQENGEILFKFLSEKIFDLNKIIDEEIENLRAEMAVEH